MERHTTLLRLPEDAKALLEAAKAVTGKSQNQLIIDAIKQALGDYPAAKLSILDRLDQVESKLATLE
ncbi:hypothetical protein LC608_16955 [Nostoc sp. XA010]|uniref:ribbon-helix-helix protein, CopG family n=1 Tax=Nostoc sp. XA010 TaxID=2780407 RepID=UPI001E384DF5|nr:ribbon-helix-helix protein, CopG family [Nostoc sp. XA010]MCC5658645.1 hypothetical protein [Nostoc sp. XA010]